MVSLPISRPRWLVIAVTVTGCAAASAGCSSGSRAAPPAQGRPQAPASSGAAGRIPDPAGIAQIKSRTLGPQAEGGFSFFAATGPGRAAAMPFHPPAGTADHVCNALIAPFLVLPQGFLSSATSVFPQAERHSPSPANWFENITVYPTGEAASIQAHLRALLGGCGHFRWAVPSATALWMRAAVTSLPGIGDSTMYASIRTLPAQPGAQSLAWDWVLIRSGNTLVVLDDQGSIAPTATAPNTVMTQLVKDAWQRYSAGG